MGRVSAALCKYSCSKDPLRTYRAMPSLERILRLWGLLRAPATTTKISTSPIAKTQRWPQLGCTTYSEAFPKHLNLKSPAFAHEIGSTAQGAGLPEKHRQENQGLRVRFIMGYRTQPSTPIRHSDRLGISC